MCVIEIGREREGGKWTGKTSIEIVGRGGTVGAKEKQKRIFRAPKCVRTAATRNEKNNTNSLTTLFCVNEHALELILV